MSDSRTVYLIDDDPSLLRSVEVLLQIEGYGVKPFASAEEFLETADSMDSGVVVTDVNMKGMSGVTLLSEMAERKLGMPVIVITAYADVSLAVNAMKLGARDLLEKPFAPGTLVAAIDHAFEENTGEFVAGVEVKELTHRFTSLTGREKEVLEGVLHGYSNKMIAHEMAISRRTVEIHRANLMKKMGAKSVAELVQMTIVAKP